VTAWEIIEEATRTELLSEDGDPRPWSPLPGLGGAGIERLGQKVRGALPRELRELLLRCSGVDGTALETLDFTGSLSFGFEAAFPSGLPIGHDGFGNFWVLDVTSADTEVAPVFFACHDPPICLLQSSSIATFMRELVRMSAPPFTSQVDDVHEDRLFRVWRENPGTLTVAEALAGDEVLAGFASGLEPGFIVVDLRTAPVGMGFSWGRYGPRTVVRRHGEERLFAYGRGGSKR
jgi:SMI1 / KNR4 family (SUKH-1)